MADEGEGERRARLKEEVAALPREVQEHLGRRLRTALQAEDGKPSFLGDTNLPPEFERIVRRLEAGARGERQGYEAVKRALGDLDFGDPADRSGKP
jgi:hypothetical protein